MREEEPVTSYNHKCRNNFRIPVLYLPVSLLELLELPADDGGEGAPHYRPWNPVLRQARREQVNVARVVINAARVKLRGPTGFDKEFMCTAY